jgi:hypothetical protein
MDFNMMNAQAAIGEAAGSGDGFLTNQVTYAAAQQLRGTQYGMGPYGYYGRRLRAAASSALSAGRRLLGASAAKWGGVSADEYDATSVVAPAVRDGMASGAGVPHFSYDGTVASMSRMAAYNSIFGYGGKRH